MTSLKHTKPDDVTSYGPTELAQEFFVLESDVNGQPDGERDEGEDADHQEPVEDADDRVATHRRFRHDRLLRGDVMRGAEFDVVVGGGEGEVSVGGGGSGVFPDESHQSFVVISTCAATVVRVAVQRFVQQMRRVA